MLNIPFQIHHGGLQSQNDKNCVNVQIITVPHTHPNLIPPNLYFSGSFGVVFPNFCDVGLSQYTHVNPPAPLEISSTGSRTGPRAAPPSPQGQRLVLG